MKKTYQPLVIKRANETIEALKEIHFFEDKEISSTDYAQIRLCDILTENFINGELTETDPIFTEEEFNIYIKEVVVHNVLEGLVKKGIVGSYEDDDVEEVFFMTEEGKRHMIKIDDYTKKKE
jgi:hypothetical protein